MIKQMAAVMLLATHQAAAAQAPCLTRQEISNLFIFSAPTLIGSAAGKCATVLPQDAFLRTGSAAMVERLRAEAEGSSKGVVEAIGKLAGEKMPAGLSETTSQGLIRDIIGAELSKDINPNDCPAIDALVSAMAPLPAANLGMMIASILELAGGTKKKSPFRICAEPPQ